MFTNNTSGSDGGGIANPGMLTVTNSTIEDNSAPFGGGIENEGTLTVTGSTIESNTANSSGFGGGIDNDDGGVTTLTSTTIDMNSAVVKGGGIFNSAIEPADRNRRHFLEQFGAVWRRNLHRGRRHDPHNQLTITGSTLSEQRRHRHVLQLAAVAVSTTKVATVSISGSTLSDNTAPQGGGGIYANAGALTIMDSTLSGNSVTGSSAPAAGCTKTVAR